MDKPFLEERVMIVQIAIAIPITPMTVMAL
jgi:hypothetical protein